MVGQCCPCNTYQLISRYFIAGPNGVQDCSNTPTELRVINNSDYVRTDMDLLPTIAVFVVVALVLVGMFSLVSFIYFKNKRKRSYLNQQFSPDDNVYDPYRETKPINQSKFQNDKEIELTLLKPINTHRINLSSLKSSRVPGTPVNLTAINQLRNSTMTGMDSTFMDDKYVYISRLVNYNKSGLQLCTNETSSIKNAKVFKNLKWENSFISSPVVQVNFYKDSQQNFKDLLEIFKLEQNQFKAVKFTVEVTVRNCDDEKFYYLEDMPKLERVEVISEEEYKRLKAELNLD